jgi:hypothetical protein
VHTTNGHPCTVCRTAMVPEPARLSTIAPRHVIPHFPCTALMHVVSCSGARKDLSQLLEMDPTDADTLKNLAEAAKGQGELEMAQGYFLRLLSEFPDQVRGGAGQGVVYTDGRSEWGCYQRWGPLLPVLVA